MSSYEISTDPARLDLDVLHTALHRVYSCHARSRETLAAVLANSLNFSAYSESGNLAGFVRVIPGEGTAACLADAFILEQHRGQGLPKLLIDAVRNHPDLQSISRFTRAAGLADGFYRQAGPETEIDTEILAELPGPV